MTRANFSEAAQANEFKLFLSVAIQRSSILGGIKLAIVVGVIVNLINQGEHLFGLQFAQVSWPKLLITFGVPFCVSIYNSTTTRLRFDPGVRAAMDATLTCRTCDHTLEVKKDGLVPDCTPCAQAGKSTRWSRNAA